MCWFSTILFRHPRLSVKFLVEMMIRAMNQLLISFTTAAVVGCVLVASSVQSVGAEQWMIPVAGNAFLASLVADQPSDPASAMRRIIVADHGIAIAYAVTGSLN